LLAEQRAESARLKAEADALAAERAELARQREEIAAAQRTAAPAPVPAPTPAPVPAPHPAFVPSADSDVMNAAAIVDFVAAPTVAAMDAALADQVNGGLGVVSVHVDAGGEIVAKHLPLVDVIQVNPAEEGAARASSDLPALLAHIAKAFDTKFPSQPKPSIEWWSELKRLAAGVAQ
jgi:hypothetical protein